MWFEPRAVTWLSIILYVCYLLIGIIAGLIIKKKYKKKISLLEADQFSLEDAKKDAE